MEITQEHIDQFRHYMQGFSNTEDWSDRGIEQELNEAEMMLGSRWGGYEDKYQNWHRMGLHNLAAHKLSIKYRQGTDKDPSAIDPTAVFNVSSKSVGDENVAYRITEMMPDEEDQYTLTEYGREYRRLRKIVSTGGIIA